VSARIITKSSISLLSRTQAELRTPPLLHLTSYSLAAKHRESGSTTSSNFRTHFPPLCSVDFPVDRNGLPGGAGEPGHLSAWRVLLQAAGSHQCSGLFSLPGTSGLPGTPESALLAGCSTCSGCSGFSGVAGRYRAHAFSAARHLRQGTRSMTSSGSPFSSSVMCPI
jgi:hypothetical protein